MLQPPAAVVCHPVPTAGMQRPLRAQLSRSTPPVLRAAPAAAALLATLAGAQAPGTPPPPPDPALLRRIEALEHELRELRGRADDDGRSIEALQRERSATHALGTAEPRYPEVRVTGFFHLDAGYYLQDDTSKATLGDIGDALGFRRARLAATGKVAEDVSFIMEFDAAQAQARFVDVWMQLDDTPIGRIRLGRFRQPFGMDELTSVRELAFLERSLTFALAPFRQTGVQIADTAFGERTTWAVSGYRYVSDNFGNVFSDSGGYGFAARITGLLLDEGDEGLIHVGADYSRNTPGLGTVRFATQNEFFGGENPLGGPAGLSPSTLISVPLFVDTGDLPANHVDLFDVELGAAFGAVAVQAEARLARADLGATAETFPGGYVQARWVLTGERIPYVKSGGVFGRVQPAHALGAGGPGAIELAARLSYLDLNGNTTMPGRSVTASTIGVSWYLNARTKLQFNWIHDELDDTRPNLGNSSTDTFALRAQIDF